MKKTKKVGIIGCEPNKEGTWGVVDEKGKIIEKFRLRLTADLRKVKLESNRKEKLEVIRLIHKKLF